MEKRLWIVQCRTFFLLFEIAGDFFVFVFEIVLKIPHCADSGLISLKKMLKHSSTQQRNMICFLLEGLTGNVDFALFAAEIMVENFAQRNRHEIDVHDDFIWQQRLLRVVYNGFLVEDGVGVFRILYLQDTLYSIYYIYILVMVVIRVFFHSLGSTETHGIHVWNILIYLHLVDSYDKCRYIYNRPMDPSWETKICLF